jgi:hypothetical protein
VPLSYLAADAELQYAGNIHVAQGRTVDTSHLLVTDTLDLRAFYVATSRGRLLNTAQFVSIATYSLENSQSQYFSNAEKIVSGRL